MLLLGLRVGLGTIPLVINLLISSYELLIILRVIMHWLNRASIVRENGFGVFLYRATEPVLYPIRQTIVRTTGYTRYDLSPVVAIALCLFLKWLVKIIF